jgi:hypothetical protein
MGQRYAFVDYSCDFSDGNIEDDDSNAKDAWIYAAPAVSTKNPSPDDIDGYRASFLEIMFRISYFANLCKKILAN